MKRFNHFAVGVQRGGMVLFKAFDDGGDMWTGHGPRESRHEVRFEQAFAEAPVVHIGLSMWDIDNGDNQRADISTDAITNEGFTIVFRTWGATRVARVRAEWLAIGAAHYEDNWDV
ncbi:MAG: H-type lectin domain-containing protein [Paracoccus sp. (in: a-proteobacteria)]